MKRSMKPLANDIKLHLLSLFVLGSSLIMPQSGSAEMTLGDPPRAPKDVSGLPGGGPRKQSVTGGFSVNTDSREQVRGFYSAVFSSSIGVSMNTAADVSTCTPGTNATAFQEAVLRRINFYRAMAGIPAAVTLNGAEGTNDQQAAVMMSRNNSLNHYPPNNWACFTGPGANAASNSNLALGADGADSITLYIQDPGSANTSVGHRRWILYPQTQVMGTGDVPAANGFEAANATWVMDANLNGSRPATRQGYVAWPPEGFVPYQVVFPQWSFGLSNANLSGATVSMTSNGVPVAVTIQPYSTSYGENTLVWHPSALDPTSPSTLFPFNGSDTTYSITISNIGVGASHISIGYNVTVFDPALPGADYIGTTITGPSQIPATTGTPYSCRAPNNPNVTGYQWRTSQSISGNLVDNANNGLANFTISPAPDYPIITNAPDGSGSCFHLAHPDLSETVPQLLQLNRVLLPSSNTTVSFKSELGYASTDETARFQISADGGLTWHDLYTLSGVNGQTELGFSQHTFSLSSYAGQSTLLRFIYDFSSGSFWVAYPNGWYIENIVITNAEQLVNLTTNSTASTNYTFTPTQTGNYNLEAQGVIFTQFPLGWGPAKLITAIPLVTTTADSGPGSLRQVASAVPGGGTVTFATNLSGQNITLTSGQIAITNNLTIDASALPNGIFVNGNHNSRIFNIAGGAALTLNSLTLTNGYAAGGGSGGAIVNNGTLALNRCTLAGNSANGDGGAIDNGGPLTLTACALVNNIGNFAGAIQNYSSCTMTNCTLAGNYATNNGGAIDSDFSAVLTLTHCTFFGNTAGNVGGAVDNYLSTLIVANSILAGSGGGGDIYSWSGSALNIYGTNIVPVSYSLGTNGGTGAVLSSAPLLAPLGTYGGPTQTMPPLAGSPAIDAGSPAVAAGITTDQRGFPRVVGPSADIGAVEYQSAPLVSNNTDNAPGSLRYVITHTTNGTTISFAPGLGGSTVLLTGGQIAVNHSATLDASALTGGLTINGNGAGRVFAVGSGNTVTMNSLTITNGYDVTGTGGGILNNGGLTLNQCVVAGNIATNATGMVGFGGGGIYNQSGGALALVECTVANNSGAGYPSRGGGVFNLGTLNVVQSTISSNYAAFAGGGIFNNSGVTALVLNSTVVGNNSQYGGGIDNFAGPLVVVQSTVVGNTGPLGGGGIFNYVSPAAITVINSIVASNSSSQGGDIDNSYNVTLVGANIIQSEYGGIVSGPSPINANPLLAPLANYGGPTQTMPTLPGSPAIDAGSDAAAAGIATDQRGFPRVVGPSVDIGAVEFQASPVVVTNDSGPGSLRYAAAWSAPGSEVTFATNLSGSTIPLTSGVIPLSCNLTIDASSLPHGVQINGNHQSPAFSVSGGTTATLNALTITNCYAGTNNSGGAIINGGTLVMNRCTLANNRTDTTAVGGAIYNNGPLTMTACTLSGNSSGFAGAIQNYSSCALVNCTFAGNTAANGNGGAIDSDFAGAVLTLTQCTFSGNSTAGVGGAVDNYLATMNLANSVLAGDNGGGDIYSWSGSTVNVYGTNIVPALYNFGTNGGTGTVLTSSPLLSPLGNYGGPTQTMPPSRGSPAINAGSDAVAAGITTDQRGYPRVSGAHVDIGSVEVQIATTPPELADAYWSSSPRTFQFGFTNLAGGSFTVFASTNVAAPRGTWTNIGTAAEFPPGSGHFEFIDPQATNYPHRFYQVGSP